MYDESYGNEDFFEINEDLMIEVILEDDPTTKEER